jgi:hypothetical protein
VSAAGAAAVGGSGGVPICAGGAGVEVCNGIDDDCDGEIDEDLPIGVMHEPVAVRSHEGRTDLGLPIDCSSCGWAWHPQLVMPNDELGVVWYLGIWGGSEQPSGFYRRLTWELEPEGEVASIGSGYWLSALGRGTTRTGTELLTFVERKNQQDLPSFAALGRDFALGPSVSLSGCAAAAYGGLLTPLFPGLVSCASPGQVHAFALDDGGTGVEGFASYDLGFSGDAEGGRAVAAQHAESALLALPFTPNVPGAAMQLWTHRMARNGAPLGEALRQELDSPRGLHLEGLFSTSDGYLLFGDDRGPGAWPKGRFVVPLDLDGRESGDMTHYDVGDLADFDEVAVTRVGTGFVVTETTPQALVVERLSDSGSILEVWRVITPTYSEPSVLVAHGRLYVAFVEPPPPNRGENRVIVTSFGCAPP